ncbi:MAG: ethanolamine ammonia-lyase reactivating factor EutA [Oscillospiraceae bacterium]|nr:ethanolamine ammonia-lyase reactivating factor EutA [Oscillospiraceae bacterium]
MYERLCSVGLDVGTTSTQLIVSQLEIQNLAGSFTVPEMQITNRTILYQSPVYFTPLKSESLVDGDGIRKIVETEYEEAGIRREDVDTGAVIITGETSRKENAAAVLDALSELSGDFVVATAGPDLESILAAKGAGAVEYSKETGQTVLHMDIGGGTSNLALIEDGKITVTGCLNVGGRLLKLDSSGKINYISPVLKELCKLPVGEIITKHQAEEVAALLVQALEMAAGLREKTPLWDKLWTTEAGTPFSIMPGKKPVLSFSGGVADCIEKELPWLQFGDLGPVLGQMIRKSRLCEGPYRLGDQTIRATVIGAGCHSAQLSGSTVYHRNIPFPLKNRPVVRLTEAEQQLSCDDLAKCIAAKLSAQDTDSVLSLPGWQSPDYNRIKALADAITGGFGNRPIAVAVEQDMAKALGQAIALRTSVTRPCLCIDRVRLTEGSYLDVAPPVGPCLPVVVKTLILSQ